MRVIDIIQETPDVRTFRLDNSAGKIPLDYPGRFVKVCVPIDGRDVWRSFTISSSPTDAGLIELTVKLNPAGEVSNYLFREVEAGDAIQLKGPQGGFYFDPEQHTEPLVLISAGSGITPMMSIARFLKATGNDLECLFLYGARTSADIIFHEECLRLADERSHFRYEVTLSQPGESWPDRRGRLNFDVVEELVLDVSAGRYFLCGPNDFMESLQQSLREAGVPQDRIHTEQFHSTKVATASP